MADVGYESRKTANGCSNVPCIDRSCPSFFTTSYRRSIWTAAFPSFGSRRTTKSHTGSKNTYGGKKTNVTVSPAIRSRQRNQMETKEGEDR